MQRQVLQQWYIGDDHPGSMGAGIARHTFHVTGGVDQVAQVICFLVNLLELRGSFEGVFDGDGFVGNDRRNGFGDPVNL